jgi:hypothetical protein
MNAPVSIRDARGRILPGHSLNPGGERKSPLADLRRQYEGRLPALMEKLFQLSRSKKENIRLAAIKEILDRVCGKAVALIESRHQGIDVGEAYLAALIRCNQPKTVDAASLTLPSEQNGSAAPEKVEAKPN